MSLQILYTLYMFMIVKKSNVPIKKITDDKKQLNEIVDIDDKLTLNVAEVTDYREKNTASYNRVYYIYDGLMALNINNQEIELSKGDGCFVEKGTKFEMKGTFNVIIVSQPVLRL
jgi:mannose-6-phosphate isomerase class I